MVHAAVTFIRVFLCSTQSSVTDKSENRQSQFCRRYGILTGNGSSLQLKTSMAQDEVSSSVGHL